VNTKKLTLDADLGEKGSEGGCEKNLSALQTSLYSNLQASLEMMYSVYQLIIPGWSSVFLKEFFVCS